MSRRRSLWLVPAAVVALTAVAAGAAGGATSDIPDLDPEVVAVLLQLISHTTTILAKRSSATQREQLAGLTSKLMAAVAEAAERCAQYYMNHRWLGGTLNRSTFGNRIGVGADEIVLERVERLRFDARGRLHRHRLLCRDHERRDSGHRDLHRGRRRLHLNSAHV